MYFISTEDSGFIILIVAAMILMTLPAQKISYDIYKGKIPDFIKTFPMHIPTDEDVSLTKGKVNHFIDSLSRGIEAKLEIDQNDLNNLYTRGQVLNMLLPGRYAYYAICNRKIIERRIDWPDVSCEGYCSQKESFDFFVENDTLRFRRILF